MFVKPWNRTIEVHAFADSAADHGVRFELRNPSNSDNPPIQPGSPPRIPFNKDREPIKGGERMKALDWHRVRFELVDSHSLGLRFHDNKFEALWAKTAKEEERCPTRRCRHKHFHPLSREDSVLMVRNNNYDVEEIAFTLNFLRPGDDGYDPSTFIPCDPIGGNEDRGTGITYRSMIGLAVGTASVATVGAIVFVQEMFKSKRPSRRPRKTRANRARSLR